MANTVAALPPYRALLAVDVKEFSNIAGRYHARATESIPVVLHSAFQRCGLADVWRAKRFQFPTGDGCALGFPTEFLPSLFNPFLQALQDELDYRAQIGVDPFDMRMRVSINVGPVTDSGDGMISEGSGVARIETHRLLDSEPVRDLLARSGPSTRVAAVVSGRAFHDAVASGYAADPPASYVRVPVEVKSFSDLAYLRVPSPTGELLLHGFLPRRPEVVDAPLDAQRQEAAAGRRDTYTINGSGNMNTGSGTQFNGANSTFDSRRQP